MKITVLIRVYRGREFLWSEKITRILWTKRGVPSVYYKYRYIQVANEQGMWMADVQDDKLNRTLGAK